MMASVEISTSTMRTDCTSPVRRLHEVAGRDLAEKAEMQTLELGEDRARTESTTRRPARFTK
jgi:hypothetical protein